MLEAGLVLSRFLHYAAVLTLFGAALFPLYAYPTRADGSSARVLPWLRGVLLAAALLALISGILWFLFTAANMAGDLSGAADRDTLALVVTETGFGGIWLARLVLATVILAVLVVRTSIGQRDPDRFVAVLCAVLAASLAGVGHTQVQDGLARIIHVGADGAHLLAAGAWLGVFPPLLYLVSTAARPGAPQNAAANALLRFSGVGQVAVATLIASGLINSWYLVGSFDLISTPYGQLLLLKIALFLGMLSLAALNRFWLVPALMRKSKSGAGVLARLRGHIVGEQVLGTLVILVVSLLGTMEPAANASIR
jgi:putative copper resistance protein D